MLRHWNCVFTIGLLFLGITSCTHSSKTIVPEKIEIKINRFETELFKIDLYSPEEGIKTLKLNYPQFLPLFSHKIIEIGSPEQIGYNDRLIAFISNFTIYRVNDRVKEVFPDLNSYENQLAEGFGRWKKIFPGYSIPEIVSCISGFNQSIITSDSLLIISLDKYLGANDQFYKYMQPPIPEYQRKLMTPEKMVPDVLTGWMAAKFPNQSKKEDLISEMIYYGRNQYLVKKLLPDLVDSVWWGYNTQQINFLHNNEKMMWSYLIENKLLFDTDKFMILKFVGDAPFTKDFSQDSPGRAGVWLGQKIVSAYMKNTNSSLLELMQETDFQKVLNQSKYNP